MKGTHASSDAFKHFPALNVIGSLKVQRLLTAANLELPDQVDYLSI